MGRSKVRGKTSHFVASKNHKKNKANQKCSETVDQRGE